MSASYNDTFSSGIMSLGFIAPFDDLDDYMVDEIIDAFRTWVCLMDGDFEDYFEAAAIEITPDFGVTFRVLLKADALWFHAFDIKRSWDNIIGEGWAKCDFMCSAEWHQQVGAAPFTRYLFGNPRVASRLKQKTSMPAG